MITKTKHRYITISQRILEGKSVIKGTRTPVRAIVELWRMGISQSFATPQIGADF